jgi:hypothetical protein
MLAMASVNPSGFYLLSWSQRILIAGSFGLFTGCIGALFSGIKTGVREMKTRPNQGMRLTLRTALQTGAAMGAVGALCIAFMMIFTVVYHPPYIGLDTLSWHKVGAALREFLPEMPVWVLAFGATGAILNGGAVLLRHWVLRLFLRRRGFIPAKYAEFLDYCARLILLRKVGNGYIFAHRLLMEHLGARSAS